MEQLLPLLAVAAVAAVAFLVRSAQKRARLRAWRTAARRAGLAEIEEADGFFESSLRGRVGELHVRIASYRRGKHETGTRITIEGLNHGTGGLSLRAEGFGSTLQKLVGEREIELGDEGFDKELYVKGSAALARAVLDAAARRSLVRLVQGRVGAERSEHRRPRIHLAESVLSAEVRDRPFADRAQEVSDVLGSLLSIAQGLIAPRDFAARIAENLPNEPLPEVRLRSLKLLAGSYSRHPATHEALLAARGDASGDVRLQAALALGEEGHETLLALASDESAEDACGARAVAALGTTLVAEQAEAILRSALKARRLAVARAALTAFARAAGAAALPLLAKVLALEGGELGAAAATALGGLKEAGVEAPLVEALRASDAAVRVASAQALGCSASVSAVPALRAAGEGDDEREVRRAARQAIAEIQSRLSGAEPGQLSLAAGAAGELSLAEGEAGSLSLADDARTVGAAGAIMVAAEEEPAPAVPSLPARREKA